MKYIRTKYGVYEALESFKTPEGYFYFSYEQKTNDALNPIVRESVYDYDLIKQADNIEELCDFLVIKVKDKEKPYVESMSELKNLKMLNDFGGTYRNNLGIEFVYGAIWIDKGLIYVAKLNEKGNWELI